MKTCTIFDSDRFMIESHDNGGAYTIFRKRDNESVYISYGDDANAFREEFDVAMASVAKPPLSAVDLVNYVCSQYFDLY